MRAMHHSAMGGPKHPANRVNRKDGGGGSAMLESKIGSTPACVLWHHRSDGNAYASCSSSLATMAGSDISICAPFRIAMDGFLPKRGGIEADGAPVANEGLILHFLKREIWVVIVQRLGDALY